MWCHVFFGALLVHLVGLSVRMCTSSARIRDDIIRLAMRAVVEVVVPLGLAEPSFLSS